MFTTNRRGRRWDASQWTSVDDRVRGGKSVSQLDVSDPKDCATFRGNLDIKTLGGAGFASQKTISELFADGLDLSSYDTLVVDVHRPASDDKTYTLILKDTESLPKRPDGREQSTVSWEHDFRLGSSSNGGHLAMHFGDFKPTYRGRPKPDTEPLNLQNILSMSIMMRRCVPSVCSSAVCRDDTGALTMPWCVTLLTRILKPFRRAGGRLLAYHALYCGAKARQHVSRLNRRRHFTTVSRTSTKWRHHGQGASYHGR